MGGKARGGRRVDWQEGWDLAMKIIDAADDEGVLQDAYIAGSIARWATDKDGTVGDVDIVIIPPEDLDDHLRAFLLTEFNINGGERHLSGLVDGVQVDVLITDEDGGGAAIMYLTGSKETNIKQRAKAKAKGYKLNEYGLWKDGVRLPCSCNERLIYKELGLEWLEARDR
jgi:DNA polymerase (family 10)